MAGARRPRGFGDRPPAAGEGQQPAGTTGAQGVRQAGAPISPACHTPCECPLPPNGPIGRISTRRRPLPSGPHGLPLTGGRAETGGLGPWYAVAGWPSEEEQVVLRIPAIGAASQEKDLLQPSHPQNLPKFPDATSAEPPCIPNKKHHRL